MNIPLLVQTQDVSEFHNVLTLEGIHIEKNTCTTIQPMGQNIRIDQIRSLRTYLTNSGSASRQIIFYSFQKASHESQNALLKLLEESGLKKFRFALQVDSIEHVLSTIRSRCRVLVCEIKNSQDVSRNILHLDSLGANLFHKNMTVSKKDEAEIIILELLIALRLRLKKGEVWTIHAIKNMLNLLHLMKQNNLNPQLVLDQCILMISSRQ